MRKGLNFLAACFSRSGLQYTYVVQLARKQYENVRKPGNSVNCQLLKNACKELNVHGQKNHKLVSDRGFTNVTAFLEVLKMGQQACGTFTLTNDVGVLKNVSKTLLKEAKQTRLKGAWDFACAKFAQLAAYIWIDSSNDKSVNFLSTFHNPEVSKNSGLTLMRKQKNPFCS